MGNAVTHLELFDFGEPRDHQFVDGKQLHYLSNLTHPSIIMTNTSPNAVWALLRNFPLADSILVCMIVTQIHDKGLREFFMARHSHDSSGHRLRK
ncbi:hypothetical protein C8J56DRAFT_1065253 [Mycena floridula]|nr:hypothetical protein C8J56DRAFT_1065253 [Mycena floridula]